MLLCDFSMFRYEEDDPSAAFSFRRYAAILLIGSPSITRLFYLVREYFLLIWIMDGHIASDKGASICE